MVIVVPLAVVIVVVIAVVLTVVLIAAMPVSFGRLTTETAGVKS